MPFFLSKSLAIAFVKFLSHEQSQVVPITGIFPNIQLGISAPSSVVIILPLFTFITWNFHVGCYRTLPLGATPSSMFNNTYNHKTVAKHIMSMEIYNIDRCNIYNDHLAKKQTNMRT